MIFIAEVFPLIKQWVSYTEVTKVMTWAIRYVPYIFIFNLADNFIQNNLQMRNTASNSS